MSQKIKYAPGEYYGLPKGTFLCCMCGHLADYIAPETEEYLCQRCVKNNDEARTKK